MRIYFHNIWIIRWCWYGLFFCQKKTVRACEWASASPALVFIFVIFTHSFSFCLSWMVFVECAVLQQEQEQNKRAKARAKLQHCSGLIMLIERIDDGDMRTVFMCAFVCSIYICVVCVPAEFAVATATNNKCIAMPLYSRSSCLQPSCVYREWFTWTLRGIRLSRARTSNRQNRSTNNRSKQNQKKWY